MMRKLSLLDLAGIAKDYMRSENYLDNYLIDYFRKQFKGDMIFLDKGRSALESAFIDFDINNCEVIIPSFICSDVFVPLFKKYNIKPRLVDCESGKLTMDLKQVDNLINKKTKAIIAVHTLGIPNHPQEIRRICDNNKLIFIEDCAHSISNKLGSRYLGSFGDAAIFSFVKEFPSFIGGMYINNKKKINSSSISKIETYRFNKGDLKFLISKFKIYRILKFFKKNSTPDTNTRDMPLCQIMKMPKIGKAFLVHFLSKFSIERKKKFAEILYLELIDKKIKMPLDLADIRACSGKSLPLIFEDQKGMLDKLFSIGLNPGVGWTPTLSKVLKSKQRTPIAEYYSKHMIAISLDEINDKSLSRLAEISFK
jgi:dTDP-4-amino-4,6-dideoxygalactose transaminase